jgi:DNA polymerase delta subunit 4
MPATRRNRTSGGPAARGAQSTLSFGGNRNKITKSSLPISSKGKKELIEDVKVETLKTEEPITTEPSHVTSDAGVIEQAKVGLSKPKSEAERLAEKVTDAQIKGYWRGREAERTVERGNAPCLSDLSLGSREHTLILPLQFTRRDLVLRRRCSDISTYHRNME